MPAQDRLAHDRCRCDPRALQGLGLGIYDQVIGQTLLLAVEQVGETGQWDSAAGGLDPGRAQAETVVAQPEPARGR